MLSSLQSIFVSSLVSTYQTTMAKSRRSCFVYAILVIAHLCNCEAVLSQKEHDKVSQLPGQNFNVNFAHYSGFVTTNEKLGRALFYWLFEASEDPVSKPLVLWLNGGPGCSSVGFGEAEEIGPFHIKSDGKTLYLNQHSWNQAANILFLDAPVGVGFSYSNTSSDLLTNGDKRTVAALMICTAQDSLTFLLKWVERYPEYKGREFYIVGESYAGHYIPQLSQAIVKHNQASGENTINLKGYMVGNGLMDDIQDRLGLFQYMWSLGFISDQTYTLLKLKCGSEPFMIPFIYASEACKKVLKIADKEMGNIDRYSVFTPACVTNSSQSSMLLNKKRPFVSDLSRVYDPCTKKHSKVYFNLPKVQKALHVPPQVARGVKWADRPMANGHGLAQFTALQVAPSKWDTCSKVVGEHWKDSPSSVLDIYHELIAAGLRIWVFSGDADAIVPVTSTRYSINALNLSTLSPYGPWYIDGQVVGWSQQYAGLNFVIVRGSGHEVALHRPKEALALFKAFISGTPLTHDEF
uniref:Carboxypeptidase n=1 Tax=Brassica oleracea var. oleracea TaxID=109376 RepID=A0A0D3A309_BRAOL